MNGQHTTKADTTAWHRRPRPPLLHPRRPDGQPTILGFGLAANTGEIELGKLGEAKATARRSGICQQMVSDHTMMLQRANSLATKLNECGTSADNLPEQCARRDEESHRQSAAWIGQRLHRQMIDDHQKVLDKLRIIEDRRITSFAPRWKRRRAKCQHLTKAQTSGETQGVIRRDVSRQLVSHGLRRVSSWPNRLTALS